MPTSDNPAACASRGLLPEEVAQHTLCWEGPSWLKEEPLIFDVVTASVYLEKTRLKKLMKIIIIIITSK